MTGHQKGGLERTRRVNGSRKRLSVLALLTFVMIVSAACIDDLTPEGGWSSPVVENDKLFVGNRDGNLVRFDPATGNLDQNWRYPRGDGLGAIYSSPVIVGDKIYGAGYTCRGDNCDGEIFALNLADGSSIWGQTGLELKTKLVGPIGIVGSTLLVGTGELGEEDDGPEGYLYGLDASTGASSIVKWRIALDGNAWSGVAIDGSTAYVGTTAGTIYAVDTSDADRFSADPDSRILWTFEAEGAVAGPILARDGDIFFGDLGSNVYKLDASARSASPTISRLNTGTGEWKFEAGAWGWARPVLEGGTVFVSVLDGTIYALDEATGTKKWSATIDGQIVAAPTLFDRKRGETRERALAVPSGEKNVRVISVIDGRELGVFVTDEPVKSTPLVHGGNLYVHTLNGDLKWFSVDDTNQRGCIDLKGGGRCD
ncbi:MAG: PQQ-binding-like beta-propeller repeat protein [Chloroflexi bacterium]|nr:PQQ-binding-like beta-propeller repeat protein [Chloroflexota bacterium]